MTRRATALSRAFIPGVLMALVLAACQGPGAGSPSAAASAAGDATLAVAESAELGEHVVDTEGWTLYIFLNDSPGQSVCAGDCAETWPPATVEDGDDLTGDGVTGEIATIERDDGSLQLTLEGWPLYRYAADEAPGDTTGEGVGDVWFVARPDGSLPDEGGESAEPSTEDGEESDDPYDY
jgi:predicted lipoprotein with Yx(FWY)xxD motif